MPGENEPAPVRTLDEALGMTAAFFRGRGVDSPRATAEWLAARLLRCARADLAATGSRPLPDRLLEALGRGARRIASGEPLQYVIGQWDFRDFTLRTDRRALVPRPETEQLVDLVLSSPRLRSLPAPRLVDYGTGTGCIAFALARAWPAARIAALDVSEEALALARENAAALGLADRVAFVNCAETELDEVFEGGSVDAIVSNPPYVPTAQWERLAPKVRDHEPRLALDGGADGMDVLRRVAEDASMLLAPEGELYLELDAESGQAAPMSALLRELGFDPVRSHRDLAGAERFVSASLSLGV